MGARTGCVGGSCWLAPAACKEGCAAGCEGCVGTVPAGGFAALLRLALCAAGLVAACKCEGGHQFVTASVDHGWQQIGDHTDTHRMVEMMATASFQLLLSATAVGWDQHGIHQQDMPPPSHHYLNF